ncbi:DUF1661 domain-containing protein [Porphyromonas gulae]|nr:DUF1661 domain-containing protein [Porphyromonas gulae]
MAREVKNLRATTKKISRVSFKKRRLVFLRFFRS